MGSINGKDKRELLAAKESLLKRFISLTEEALKKVDQNQEETLTEIFEKRDRIIKEAEALDNVLSKMDLSVDDVSGISELKTTTLQRNLELQQALTEQFNQLKADLGNTKQALKVNKAYQQGTYDQPFYVNQRN